MDGIPASLPALLRAQNAQVEAAGAGFDWPDAEPVFAKFGEELAEIKEALASGNRREIEAEVGDLLFTAVNLARKLGVDAETSLASSTNKFLTRFKAVEEELASDGRRMEDTPLEELDVVWEKIKRA